MGANVCICRKDIEEAACAENVQSAVPNDQKATTATEDANKSGVSPDDAKQEQPEEEAVDKDEESTIAEEEAKQQSASEMAGLGSTELLGVPSRPTDVKLNAAHNSFPLSQGRSLMDWIKCKNSGADMTGTGGRKPVRVDESMLAKHNTLENCWMLIKGKVYNVTPYMEYHPGGGSELMRAAGTDGTKLFDEYHSWVNAETMLDKCFVGHFVGSRSSLRSTTKIESPTGSLSDITSIASRRLSNLNITLENLSTTEDLRIRVRTSWRRMSVERVSADFDTDRRQLRLLLRPTAEEKPVELCWDASGWVAAERLNGEFGVTSSDDSVIVALPCSSNGATTEQLHSVNLMANCTINVRPDRKYRNLEITGVKQITHDTIEMILKWTADHRIAVPIGHHVFFKIDSIERAYTPVDWQLSNREMVFLVKIYPSGKLTEKIGKLQAGDSLLVSDPAGLFDASTALADTKRLFLFAAGTGFTPMVRLIRAGLAQMCTCRLFFFNKTEGDIVWRTFCDDTEPQLFQTVHVLSEPDDDWLGAKGQISRSFIEQYLPNPDTLGQDSLIGVCGPGGFIDDCVSFLNDIGYSSDVVHVFQG